MENIKIFLIEDNFDFLNKKEKSFKLFNIIDEKEYTRICDILNRNKISYLKNNNNEVFVDTCSIRYFDLVEELIY